MKTLKEIEAVKNQRNGFLEDVLKLSPNFREQGNVGLFIDLYLMCEVKARKLINYYNTDKKLNSKSKYINWKSIYASLTNFNVSSLSKTEVEKLFKGAEGKRGSKSARQLRNGYLHSLSQTDKKEIIENYAELNRIMQTFLNSYIS
jgi:hypothetical protein